MNNPSFGGAVDSPDPVIRSAAPGRRKLFRIPGVEGDLEVELPAEAVAMRLSAWFILPSIPALRWLAGR